jgi:hypothetical protein
MRRGDKVVVFEKRPRTRPTSIYEVMGAHRKDDEIRGLAYPPALCRLRLGLPPIADNLLDADAAALAAISDNDSGEIDLVPTRALLERLLLDQPTTLEQMRMHLASTQPQTKALLVKTPSTAEGPSIAETPPAANTTPEPPKARTLTGSDQSRRHAHHQRGSSNARRIGHDSRAPSRISRSRWPTWPRARPV